MLGLIEMKQVEFITDTCGKEFLCSERFNYASVLGEEFSIDVMLTTFEKHHRRGCADALGGETKRGTDQAVRQAINVRILQNKIECRSQKEFDEI